MTSRGELALRESRALGAEVATAALTGAQLKFIANTEFVPKAYRGKFPEIMACVAYGRALGIADMEALNEIYLIDGRPSYSAHLMSRLARGRGHSIQAKTKTDEECTLVGKRADNGDTIEVTWTIEKAERQGLTSKPNWKKMPEQMLWARAVSQLCRELFSDCFGGGAPYTPEELGAGDITADELLDGDEPQQQQQQEEEEQAGEVLAEEETTAPEPISPEQRERLLELVTGLSEQRPDVNWSQTLTDRLRKEYGVKSYNDLNGPQLDEILEYLDGELPKRRRRPA